MSERIVQRGLWFEEYDIGAIYEHRPGRTVTEADNVLFTTLTMNTQALHLDAAWSAQQPGFGGQRLINSMFTLSTIVGLSVAQLTQGTLVANLGFGEVAFSRTAVRRRHLYGETECTENANRSRVRVRHRQPDPYRTQSARRDRRPRNTFDTCPQTSGGVNR